MSASGPLVARWQSLDLAPVAAGTRQLATVELENAGTAPWRTRGPEQGIFLSYHWLDERGNPIVWDGARTALERVVSPGESLRQELALRGPIPPGTYRLAVDLVEEHRFWLAEVGSPTFEREVVVTPRDASTARTFLPAGAEPAPGWHDLVAALHAEGYAAVGGSVEAGRRSTGLAAYAPGGGRHPRFAHPLVCPSLLAPLEPNTEVAGLPAYLPDGDEPSMFDGRAVVRLTPR